MIGLVPLAIHGGPLWEPLCYAQIGGLTAATALTLLLVPVLYTVVVRDLKWVRWDEPRTDGSGAEDKDAWFRTRVGGGEQRTAEHRPGS